MPFLLSNFAKLLIIKFVINIWPELSCQQLISYLSSKANCQATIWAPCDFILESSCVFTHKIKNLTQISSTQRENRKTFNNLCHIHGIDSRIVHYDSLLASRKRRSSSLFISPKPKKPFPLERRKSLAESDRGSYYMLRKHVQRSEDSTQSAAYCS